MELRAEISVKVQREAVARPRGGGGQVTLRKLTGKVADAGRSANKVIDCIADMVVSTVV